MGYSPGPGVHSGALSIFTVFGPLPSSVAREVNVKFWGTDCLSIFKIIQILDFNFRGFGVLEYEDEYVSI